MIFTNIGLPISANIFTRKFTEKIIPAIIRSGRFLAHRFDNHILFLALNSSWETDHHFRNRSGINISALSHALDTFMDRKFDNWLKFARMSSSGCRNRK